MMSQNEKSTIKGDKKFSLPRTYICIDLKSYYAFPIALSPSI